jgi:hypothetical protein
VLLLAVATGQGSLPSLLLLLVLATWVILILQQGLELEWPSVRGQRMTGGMQRRQGRSIRRSTHSRTLPALQQQ